MADYKFLVGDVVQCLSGGPNMTVEQINADGKLSDSDYVRCVWFFEQDTDGVWSGPCTEIFDVKILKKIF